ncbi:MAG TPA: tripartite tricarboxylate transporter substrate binding protein [Burkholderiales bacterium]|jgi:tripartite-type tricarboxylate transporter receptor subunit TctC
MPNKFWGRLGLTLAALLCAPLHAQTWPDKPVRIVVPFGPGSFTDVAARALAAEMSGQLNQQFIVDNRGGAGSTLGANAVAKSAADGYTLLFTDNSFVIAPAIYAKLPYDPLKDFTQVSLVAESPSILLARAELPAKNLQQFITLAKSKPGALTFGSGGQGSSAHLAMELLMSDTGIKMTHVPFKGIAPAIAEVVAGRVDLAISSLASGMAFVQSGRLQGLAVTSKERSALLPNVPTFAEAGVPAYNANYWFGIAAPAGTPAAVLTRLHQEVVAASQKERLRKIFGSQGARAVTNTPQEMQHKVVEEIGVWKGVISKNGIKVENL